MRLFKTKAVIEKSDTCDLVYTSERKSAFFHVRKYSCVFEFYSFLDVKTPKNTVLHTARLLAPACFLFDCDILKG